MLGPFNRDASTSSAAANRWHCDADAEDSAATTSAASSDTGGADTAEDHATMLGGVDAGDSTSSDSVGDDDNSHVEYGGDRGGSSPMTAVDDTLLLGGGGKSHHGRRSREAPFEPPRNVRPRVEGRGATDLFSPGATSGVLQDETDTRKRELLHQYERLRKRGVVFTHPMTMEHTCEEITAELDRVGRDVELDSSLRFQRRMLMACVTGIEFLNSKFDPFDVHLDGWSENVNESIHDYDDIFEELHAKYRGSGKMAPELRLLMSLAGSGFMFHLTNTMFRPSSLPGVDEVLKRNPDLMKQFASATAKTMADNASAPHSSMSRGHGGGGSMGGIASLFGSMFGGGAGGGGAPAAVASPPPPAPARRMQGPSGRGAFGGDAVLPRQQHPPMPTSSLVAAARAPPPPATTRLGDIQLAGVGDAPPPAGATTAVFSQPPVAHGAAASGDDDDDDMRDDVSVGTTLSVNRNGNAVLTI